ncbi:MAG: hypothetical protein JWM11_134 [Planctomycetaceae bacterium]|nr:hypothetical protein [Planctomycetaceae bacterium]
MGGESRGLIRLTAKSATATEIGLEIRRGNEYLQIGIERYRTSANPLPINEMLNRPNIAIVSDARRQKLRSWLFLVRIVLVAVGLSSPGCGKRAEPLHSTAPSEKKPVLPISKTASDTKSNATESPAPKKIRAINDRKEGSKAGEPAATTTTNVAVEQTTTAKSPVPEVQKIYRPSDTRAVYDETRLAKHGLHKSMGLRLILYSDLPEKEVLGLPELAEHLYPAMEDYFGRLPPDREGLPYQMTAFLMGTPQRFVDAGVLSERRVQPHEGWYRGNEFWWNRQPSEYYTRHLLLHEATHCFMHVMPSVDCPPWYVEGMAELFGTHDTDAAGKLHFGIMPVAPEKYPGWARISVVQQEVKEGHVLEVDQILAFTFNDFQKLQAYAWSWALCHYLNNHPRYQKPFRELAKRMMDGGFQRQATELFARDLPDLRDEWLLFASQIQYGHDIPRSAVEFHPGENLASGTASKPVEISAKRGWQSSRVNVVAGQTYKIHANGRVTLAMTSKPWVSEPQGISIRYFAGQPLGRLLGCIRQVPSETRSKHSGSGILKLIPLGPQSSFVAPSSGTLYLRVNDAWNELHDNDGAFRVKVEG